MSERHEQHKQNGLDPLDRLLNGLGTAKVDASFAQRTTLSVKARLAPRSTQRPVLAWGFGLAAAAFASVVAVSIVLHTQSAGRTAQPGKSAPTPPQPAVQQALAITNPMPKPQRAVRLVRVAKAAVRQVEPVLAEQASYPAPPAPLTEQEKLLLKIAHTGEPIELAMLNPEIRENLLTRERREVDNFFYKPPVVDPEEKLTEKAKAKGANQ